MQQRHAECRFLRKCNSLSEHDLGGLATEPSRLPVPKRDTRSSPRADTDSFRHRHRPGTALAPPSSQDTTEAHNRNAPHAEAWGASYRFFKR